MAYRETDQIKADNFLADMNFYSFIPDCWAHQQCSTLVTRANYLRDLSDGKQSKEKELLADIIINLEGSACVLIGEWLPSDFSQCP